MSNFDLPFFTTELKTLDRKKKREYRRHKKSAKYLELKSKYNALFQKCSKTFLNSTIKNMIQSKPSKAYSILKRLGARPGDICDESSFVLSSHASLNLNAQEAADKIASHFAAVSMEYEPLNINSLPQHVKDQLIGIHSSSTCPRISEVEIWNVLNESKGGKSCIPGDLPPKIVKEFSAELAFPLSVLFNNIIQTGEWPQQWKVETGIPIPKNKILETEDDLRVVSLTANFSKILEKIVMKLRGKLRGEN